MTDDFQANSQIRYCAIGKLTFTKQSFLNFRNKPQPGTPDFQTTDSNRCEAGPRSAPLQTVNPDTGHPKPTFKSHLCALSDRQSQTSDRLYFSSQFKVRKVTVFRRTLLMLSF